MCKETNNRNLINIIEGKVSIKLVQELDSIINEASKNKVLLHVLRILNIEEPLRYFQEARMKRIINTVKILSKILKNYDYAFFKLVKPVTYVPADVDILVNTNYFRNVVKEVRGLGFKIKVKDPYCVTFVKGDLIIDLYTYPSLGGMIFINGQELLTYTTIKEINGIEIKALENYAEVLATATHAIYKERIYTLNDYFTVEKWISGKTFKLAEELKCKPVIEISLDLNRKIRQGIIKAPYKIPTYLWIKQLIQKLKEDNLTRATLVNMLKALASKRGVNSLISKFVRETY